jgi:dipeptidyl aminopeptidase/acylaminoacyl peptidase
MPKNGALLSKQEIKIDKDLLKFWKSKGVTPKEIRAWQERASKVHLYRITYRSNGYRVNGFLCEPKAGKGKLPCIIWNRGGSGDFGAITIGGVINRLGTMADWGYVVIASQYSGNAGSEGIDDFSGEKTVNDVLNLRVVLGQVKRADPSRIGMIGGSRGGSTIYRCLAKVKWIKAAVSIAGGSDLVGMMKFRADMAKRVKLFGVKTKADQIERSAIYWADKFSKKTPLLMMHGSADWRVPLTDSLELSKLLYENKVPHRLVVFEGADHGLNEVSSERNRMTRDWFDRYVRDGAPLPNLKPHGG